MSYRENGLALVGSADSEKPKLNLGTRFACLLFGHEGDTACIHLEIAKCDRCGVEYKPESHGINEFEIYCMIEQNIERKYGKQFSCSSALCPKKHNF